MGNQGTDYLALSVPEMEAAVARFSERVDAVQKQRPPTKDWVRQAIHRKGPGRSPVRLKRCSLDIILKYGDALADLLCEYPDDAIPVNPYDWAIGYQPLDKPDRVNTVEAMTRDARWVDEWGTAWGHAYGGVGATPLSYPIADLSDLDSYIIHKMPKAREKGRLDAAAQTLQTHNDKYCYGCEVMGIFERLRALRNMEDLLIEFHTDKDIIHRYLEAHCTYLLDLIQYWAETGADAMFIADDWGTQTGLLISPAMWRDMFKPYYTRIFGEVHRCGMDVIFHSCGNVTDIIGDLIDTGVDCLDPIQPGTMDFKALARDFGGHVSFSGAIDVQYLMCEGSPEDVKSAVNELIDTFGRPFGGGFLIGPANSMTPDIPFENLRAMFEACHAQ